MSEVVTKEEGGGSEPLEGLAVKRDGTYGGKSWEGTQKQGHYGVVSQRYGDKERWETNNLDHRIDMLEQKYIKKIEEDEVLESAVANEGVCWSY